MERKQKTPSNSSEKQRENPFVNGKRGDDESLEKGRIRKIYISEKECSKKGYRLFLRRTREYFCCNMRRKGRFPFCGKGKVSVSSTLQVKLKRFRKKKKGGESFAHHHPGDGSLHVEGKKKRRVGVGGSKPPYIRLEKEQKKKKKRRSADFPSNCKRERRRKPYEERAEEAGFSSDEKYRCAFLPRAKEKDAKGGEKKRTLRRHHDSAVEKKGILEEKDFAASQVRKKPSAMLNAGRELGKEKGNVRADPSRNSKKKEPVRSRGESKRSSLVKSLRKKKKKRKKRRTCSAVGPKKEGGSGDKAEGGAGQYGGLGRKAPSPFFWKKAEKRRGRESSPIPRERRCGKGRE